MRYIIHLQSPHISAAISSPMAILANSVATKCKRVINTCIYIALGTSGGCRNLWNAVVVAIRLQYHMMCTLCAHHSIPPTGHRPRILQPEQLADINERMHNYNISLLINNSLICGSNLFSIVFLVYHYSSHTVFPPPAPSILVGHHRHDVAAK